MTPARNGERPASGSRSVPVRHCVVGVVTIGIALLGSPRLAAQDALEWQRLADTIVERMSLERGERVLLVGVPGRFDPLVRALRAAVVERGGIDLGAMSVPAAPFADTWQSEFLQQAAARTQAALREVLQDVDVAVMLPGVTGGPAYGAMQDVLRDGRGRTVHLHWEGAYDLLGRPLPITPAVDRTYQRALLDTDYAALAATLQAFEQAARRGEIRVTTPAGTDIRFRIGNRPLTRQDGDASAARAGQARNLIDREVELPAGAIRVAPLEQTVQGVVVIPLSYWNVPPEEVRGLRMQFVNGTAVDVTAASGMEAVTAELAFGGDAGRAFREFALGFNPLLAITADDPWIPYYGYGAGVVRLSLGDNAELGGAVRGNYVRWNLFPDASVWVDGVQWVRDGRLRALSPD
jgi:pyrimidine operon attenuation protein/uracil phosphoribosyltransferase